MHTTATSHALVSRKGRDAYACSALADGMLRVVDDLDRELEVVGAAVSVCTVVAQLYGLVEEVSVADAHENCLKKCMKHSRSVHFYTVETCTVYGIASSCSKMCYVPLYVALTEFVHPIAVIDVIEHALDCDKMGTGNAAEPA